MIERILREPALVTGAIAAILTLLVAFNINVTQEQRDAIIQVVAITIGLFAVAIGVTRQVVTPINSPKLETGTIVTVTSPVSTIADKQVIL